MFDDMWKPQPALHFEGDTSAVLNAIVRNEPAVHFVHPGGGMAAAMSTGLAAALEALHLRTDLPFVGSNNSAGGVNQLLAAYRSATLLTGCYATHFCTPRFIKPGLRAWFDRSKASIDHYGAVLYQKLQGRAPYHDANTLYFSVTNYETGEPAVLQPDLHDLKQVVRVAKASAYLPCVGRGYLEVDGAPYTDGGVAMPIPLDSALAAKPEYLIILMTMRERRLFEWCQRMLEWLVLSPALRRAPKPLQEAVFARYAIYESQLRWLRQQLLMPLDDSRRVLPPTCIVWPNIDIPIIEQRRHRIEAAIGSSYLAWWQQLRQVTASIGPVH